MRGDETLRVQLRNLLGPNTREVPTGPYPDPVDVTPDTRRRICRIVAGMDPNSADPPPGCNPFFFPDAVEQVIPGQLTPSHALHHHVNGPHQTHVTNLHTHGLHVAPNRNPDGTHSDDVMLRLLPRGDWEARQLAANGGEPVLSPDESVGEVPIRIRLGEVWESRRAREGGGPRPHPPGTHWYHPHPHGATNDQVASGMAGFLIVEGDVDDAVNQVMTGQTRPDPERRTGPYDYRERLIFIQRVLLQSLDLDAGPDQPGLRRPPILAVNGVFPPSVFFMRPGAVERWRIVNGSVDGRGTKRFMVLEGEYVESPGELWRVTRDARPQGAPPPPLGPNAPATYEPVTRQQVEEAKQALHLLSLDGVTLVTEEGGRVRHTLKDLSRVNAGTQNPLTKPVAPADQPYVGQLRNIEDCFRDGESLRLAFNRPNEVYLGNANRADVFFKAPLGSAGKVYTIFAQEDLLNQDNTQQGYQNGIGRLARGVAVDAPGLPPLFRAIAPLDVVVGYIHVRGEPVEGGDFPVGSLGEALPDAPPYLHPVVDEELRIPAAEAQRRGAPAGAFRTRVLAYSGWGNADFPTVEVPEEFAQGRPDLKGLTWDEWQGRRVLLSADLRTMAVHGSFELGEGADPGPSYKFSGEDDPHRPILVHETAEEWVLYNTSMALWSHTDKQRFPQPGTYGLHYTAYPLSRAEGQRRFWEDPEFQITTKGNDHPFHIHINPAWVTRIDVPDENGRLHNILDEPRWMDTVQIPRAGGRVVFRSRFPDYTGRWIHHCHILAHEDIGMMQIIESTEDPARATYTARASVAAFGAPAEEVARLYPPPSLETCYRQNLRFIDRTMPGQVYPGFEVSAPTLEE
jgi:hypothetical protein